VFCAGADLKVIRETGTAATLDTAMDVARAISVAAPLAARASRHVVRAATLADDDTPREVSREPEGR